jgi:hypothetical protein
MNTKHSTTAVALVFAFHLTASAGTVLIEPDNYAPGTMLNNITPEVSLSVAVQNNSILRFSPVVAIPDAPVGYSHPVTGNLVFGPGICFWNTYNRLRMDFTAPVQSISLLFTGGDQGVNDIAKLDAFDGTGALIATATSSALSAGASETASVSLLGDQIAWAVAYLPPNEGTFGRFDHLQFSTVPEPSAGALLVTALGLLCHHQHARRRC